MVEFMVIAAPRSGTTWAANWLTTDKTLCLHDPLFTRHYTEVDGIETDKILGVSCTGLFMFHEWANKHPARKVVLHRDIKEVNRSLDALGLPVVSDETIKLLDKIEGQHYPWTALFDDPKEIYEYLTGLEFDEERHALLKEIEMQPNFATLSTDKNTIRKLINEITGG